MVETLDVKDIFDNNDNEIVLIDVRSEKEYLDDHAINSINMPILTDKERHEVGYTYKNDSKEEAVRKGIGYATYKIIDYYDEIDRLCSEGKKVVFYCFRGGMRSNSIANTMDTLNKKVYILKGGYKEYRKYVMDFIQEIPNKYKFIMLHGLTGVGKTHLLEKLKEAGEEIIDLEYLARNKGSVFGKIGYDKPTTQKLFESELVYELSKLKGNNVYIESESRRIGNVNIPDKLFETMKIGRHFLIETSLENRIKIILDDYIPKDSAKLEQFNDSLKVILNNLKKLLSTEKVNILSEYINTYNYKKFVEELLVDYYDPLYKNSIKKYEYNAIINYKKQDDAVSELMSEKY
ncbi:MAG TPA: tRNA 2-selenouridine(34) synthase MnmH [Clostridiales bacterium]|nr:MAG: tRNA 2-selenouridine(34) synthase MnmH [Clostridiales bacterium GWD2_32_19]HCC06976.1 tRNA 2-selenouridine(34) synthase MnmH [Clostridiales bacterium]